MTTSRTGHAVSTTKNEGAEWPTLILRQKRAQSETPIHHPPRPAAAPDLAGQLEKLGPTPTRRNT